MASKEVNPLTTYNDPASSSPWNSRLNTDAKRVSEDSSVYSSKTAPEFYKAGITGKTQVVEHAAPKRQLTRWQQLKRHWARFWCCYLLAGVIFLAIFLPLFFLKILPALAQLIVNKTGLPIYGGTIQAVSSDTLVVSLSTSLTVPAGLKVKLAPLILYLYNKETPSYAPFITVPLAGQLVAGHTNIAITDETVHVANLTELDTWLTTALLQNTTKLSVRANTTAYLGVLKNHINLDKTVEIPALKELEGVRIADATIVLPPADDGSNLVGSIVLPNWSQLTLGLGNNTLNIWAGDVLVGNADLVDVHLPPGNTTIPFRGKFYVDALVKNFASVLSSQAESLVDGKVNLWVNGNTSTVNGEHIAYLEHVLRSAHISTEVPIIQLLSQALGSVLKGNTTLGGLADLLNDTLGGGEYFKREDKIGAEHEPHTARTIGDTSE
ncbi:hypothetical protein HD806DRAFT_526933 [Xylariaceae sp. AK1471]|nr:hypothetical protein HD806DRAFT_526933 [Xylariaceae sp. AK1471]